MWEIVLASLKANLTKATEATFRLIGAKLLGKMLEVPEAWLDGRVQGMKDKTRARTIFSDGLARRAAEIAAKDDTVIGALVEDMLEAQITRTQNKGRIFQRTLAHISESENDDADQAAVPQEDWMAAFGRLSEDISSDQMVETFARILAGEVKAPGTFSISTLRLVSGMNQHVASEFAAICKELIEDHIFKAQKYRQGDPWLRMIMLRNEGLFSAVDSSVYQPPEGDSWRVGVNPCFIQIGVTPGMKSEIPIFNLTATGCEIAKLLPTPDYESNLRTLVAENKNKSGWTGVTLFKNGIPVEKLM